jgi:hypothetical protein
MSEKVLKIVPATEADGDELFALDREPFALALQ